MQQTTSADVIFRCIFSLRLKGYSCIYLSNPEVKNHYIWYYQEHSVKTAYHNLINPGLSLASAVYI